MVPCYCGIVLSVLRTPHYHALSPYKFAAKKKSGDTGARPLCKLARGDEEEEDDEEEGKRRQHKSITIGIRLEAMDTASGNNGHETSQKKTIGSRRLMPRIIPSTPYSVGDAVCSLVRGPSRSTWWCVGGMGGGQHGTAQSHQ